MKILYGIQGTGNGHLTRAREMAKYFSQAHIKVDYFISGRDKEKLSDMELFGAFRHARGITFCVSHGRVQPLKSLLGFNPIKFIRSVRQLDISDYDLVISDFEPVTAWAAKMQHKPSLAISHQCAFDYTVPVAGDSPATRWILKWFAPTTYRLGLHWHHFNQAILPPIIDTHALNKRVETESDMIVVYLPFEHRDTVLALLHRIPECRFNYYCDIAERVSEGNVTLHPLSCAFKQDLLRAYGVISNAGFELSSEAIHLGKRLLVKPLHGQMEQLSNAKALTALKLGMVTHELTPEAVRQWLAMPQTERIIYPNVAQAIVHWIARGQLSDVESLCDSLWRSSHQLLPQAC